MNEELTIEQRKSLWREDVLADAIDAIEQRARELRGDAPCSAAFEMGMRVAANVLRDLEENTCQCGATIASDEFTCWPCRMDYQAEADSEIERLFGRDES